MNNESDFFANEFNSNKFNFLSFSDPDYDNYEIINEMCSKLSDAIIYNRKKRHTGTMKFNGLFKKTSRMRRLPDYIQYFMLYIFSVMSYINRNDCVLITRLLCTIFKNDLHKFDYCKVIEHYKNIRNRIKHYIKYSVKNDSEEIIQELFKRSVFYNARYYYKCLRNFKCKYPDNNIVIPKINDCFYESIVHYIKQGVCLV